MARVEPGVEAKFPLPERMIDDLNDAYNYYDKEEMGYISMPHFRNILHNFGFHSRQKRETDEELRRTDPDIMRAQGVELDACRAFLGYRWNKGGKLEEAAECFNLFDKKERGMINAQDLKAVLSNYLDFQVT